MLQQGGLVPLQCCRVESRNGEAFKCHKNTLSVFRGAKHPLWPWHDPPLTFKEVICLKCGCSRTALSDIWSFPASVLQKKPVLMLKNTDSSKHHIITFLSSVTLCFKIRNGHNYLCSADGKRAIRGRHYYCYCCYYYPSSRKCSAIKTLLSSHSLLQTIKGSLHTYISFFQT